MELLEYDPETGIFVWIGAIGSNRGSGDGRLIGRRAGHHNKRRGRISIWVDGKSYLAHRLAWLYVYGQFPIRDIDHVNGDPKDNRIVNLREATPQQNARNRSHRSSNSTGYKGVRRHAGKWQARVTVSGQIISLGCFDTIEAAHMARVVAERQRFGEFARV